jgi:ArsR family transcriptional regulator
MVKTTTKETIMNNEYIRVFRAFTDEHRVRVLELLQQGEQCACVLLEDMEISQPTLSHHMKILCDSGIVKKRPVGKWSYYSINAEGCEYGSQLLMRLADTQLDKTLTFMREAHRFLRPYRRLLGLRTLADANALVCYQH